MLCINNMKNEFLKRGGSGSNAAPLPDHLLWQMITLVA